MTESGLFKNLDTQENRDFWAAAERARKTIATWPEWKRRVRVTRYSTGEDLGNGITEENNRSPQA